MPASRGRSGTRVCWGPKTIETALAPTAMQFAEVAHDTSVKSIPGRRGPRRMDIVVPLTCSIRPFAADRHAESWRSCRTRLWRPRRCVSVDEVRLKRCRPALMAFLTVQRPRLPSGRNGTYPNSSMKVDPTTVHAVLDVHDTP